MTTVLTLRLPLSTYFGNAISSTRGLPCSDFVVIETHLSLGFWSNAKQSSTSGRCGWRCRSQFRDQPQDIGQQSSRSGDLGYLEGDITAWLTTLAPILMSYTKSR
jgi:hypothetical protein